MTLPTGEWVTCFIGAGLPAVVAMATAAEETRPARVGCRPPDPADEISPNVLLQMTLARISHIYGKQL